MMRLLAVCAGTARPIRAKSGRTGHFKTPQNGAQISTMGVEGDSIVDTAHHGGPEQALYILGEKDRLWWEQTLARPLPAGFMGENLLIDGLDSADLCLGDILDIGPIRIQITAPRVPCVTFQTVLARPDALALFFASNHPGAYARVLRPGPVEAFDPVALHPYDGHRLPIPAHLTAFRAGLSDLDYLQRCLTVPAHKKLHDIARDRLAKAQGHPIS